MEPTIYKPSIYKGAGIYKTGSEGGKNWVKIGNEKYNFVRIGDLLFIDRNLNFKNDDLIFNGGPSNSPSCYYYNKQNNEPYENFGLLYNFFAVDYLEQNKDSLLNGWRVPSKTDWVNTINAIFQTSICGKLLKSKTYWPNYNGTNVFNFNAFPSGFYDPSDDTTHGIITQCLFWSCTSNDSTTAYNVDFYDNTNGVLQNNYNKECAYSLRLVKDA